MKTIEEKILTPSTEVLVSKFYIVGESDSHYNILFKKEKDISAAPKKER